MADPLLKNITVNGEIRQSSAATIADLVRELDLEPTKVAVERNAEIAPRSQLAEIALADGDVLEIVHFVGGG
ncbi:sulfur carrier protein ThiS [Sphingomonadaceae bacterium]|nr:sulfur carrier protein ThiS [Sphingomonadaceae bacterium]